MSLDAEAGHAAVDAPLPLLAIDCSTSVCTLVLRVEDQVLSYVEDLGRSHSQRILPELQRLREQANLGQQPLAAVGVVVGPGSFTGVRIAVATAQALAFAYACPVLRLDALQVVAQAAVFLPNGPAAGARWICCARRSRGDLYYFAAYAVDPLQSVAGAAAVTRVGTTVLLDTPAAVARWLGDVRNNLPSAAATLAPLWLGDLVPWLAAASPFALAPAASRPAAPPALALLSLCDSAYASGAAVSAAEALPFYLDADSPWVRRRS